MISRLSDFFFTPVLQIQSSLFRLGVGLVLTYFYFVRLLDFDFLFSENGIYPYTLALSLFPDFYRPPFILFTKTDSLMYAMHVLFVLGLVLITAGVGGRFFRLIVFLLHLVFVQRNSVTIYGPDFIATCWLLYLILMDCDQQLSIKNVLKKTKLIDWTKKSDEMNTVGIRMVQLQLCVIYAYGGMEKLKGITWWRGDAIWNTLANGQLVTMDMSFVSHFPVLIVLMTFATIIFEVYFCALVWVKSLQSWFLGFGVLLHLGIAITMNIPIFSLLMVLGYLAFMVPRLSKS